MSYHIGTGFSFMPFPASFLQPETVQFFNRCSDPKPNITLLTAIDNLIYTLKSNNVWQLLDTMHIFCQNNANNIALNLIKPTQDLITGSNPTSYFTSNYGITGDGASFSYAMDYPSNFVNFKKNSASMFVWSLNSIASLTGSDIGGSSSTNGVLNRASIRSLNFSGKQARIYANSDTAIDMDVSSSPGFCGWSRTSPTTVIGYKSGKATTFSNTSTDIPYNYISILQLSGGTTTYSPNTLALSIVGGGLSQGQIDILFNACYALLSNLKVINTDTEIETEPESLIPGYWTKSSMDLIKTINGPNFRVYQQAPPPVSNTTDNNSYLYFPISDTGSQQVDAMQPSYSTQTYIRNHHHIWQMRSIVDPNSKFNDRPSLQPLGRVGGTTKKLVKGSPPLQCWVQYSDFDKADAATEAHIRFTLGFPAHNPGYETDPLLMGYMDVANNAGIPDSDVWSWQYAYSNLNNFWTETYTSRARTSKFYVERDKIILPDSRLCDSGPMATGIVLDAEAQDGRTPARQTALVKRLAAICKNKGYEFLLYTNPLNGTGARNTGFTIDSLSEIHQTDNLYLTVVAWPSNIEKDVNQSLTNQLNLLKGPNGDQPIDYSKLILELSIGTSDSYFNASQCAIIRSYLQRGMKGVLIWRNYGQPGGSLSRYYNQVIANVLGLPNS